MSSLKLLDFSDRELLARLDDISDDEGYATSRELAEALGLTDENGTFCVAQRMSWLRRYGAVERDAETNPAKNRGWKMSEIGRLANASALKARQRMSLESLDAPALVDLATVLTVGYGRADPTIGNLVRRELIYGTGGMKSMPYTPGDARRRRRRAA